MPDQLKSGQVFIGLALVVLGVLFLLNTTGVADTGGVARWVPSLFILLGLWGMVASGFRSVQGPLTLIVIAGIVQLAVLGVLTREFFGQWWPLIPIVIGLYMLVGWFRPRQRSPRERHTDESRLFTFLGDTNERPISQAFQGAQLTTILGDATLDLRDIAVRDGTARVDVFVLLGDAKVRVPAHWTVRNNALVLLADYKDERHKPETAVEGPPELVITGLAALGDIKVID